MKIRSILIVILILGITTGLSVFATSTDDSPMSMLTGRKKDIYMAHEEKLKKAEEAAKNFKESDKKKLPPELEKYIETEEVPVNEQAGVIEDVEIPSAQIPMHSIELKCYSFTNRAFTLYNLVAAGNSVDNPNEGVLINFYINPKTGQPTQNIITIPNAGKVIITKVSDDKKKIKFKTSDGKIGIFDGTTDRKGSYTINDN